MSRQRLTQNQKLPTSDVDGGLASRQGLQPNDDQNIGSTSNNVSRRNSDASRPNEPIDEPSSASNGRKDVKGKGKAGSSKEGWVSRNITTRFGSLNLENKGSVARDHLALERTFLAWLRTSLSFASIGIAVTQLFRLNAAIGGSDPATEKDVRIKFHAITSVLCMSILELTRNAHMANLEPGALTLRQMGKPLGATFLGIAILVLLIGLNRYYESQNWLLKGKFPASRGAIIVLTLISAALIICSLIIVVAVNPSIAKG